jgi:hypothetical protein
VPNDLGTAQFMERIVGQVLRVTPVTHHVRARELAERRSLPVEEADSPADVAEAEASQQLPLDG